MSGRVATSFWIGVVLLGIIVPLGISIESLFTGEMATHTLMIGAIVCHTIGAFALKYTILKVGIYEPIIPKPRRPFCDKERAMSEKKIVYTTCKSCHGGCGVKVTVQDGIPVHIEGNPNTLTRGTMCSKGLSSIQHIDNPYRILQPHEAGGPKGRRQMAADLLGRSPGHHRGQDQGSPGQLRP